MIFDLVPNILSIEPPLIEEVLLNLVTTVKRSDPSFDVAVISAGPPIHPSIHTQYTHTHTQ
jgi:hypothetical protein